MIGGVFKGENFHDIDLLTFLLFWVKLMAYGHCTVDQQKHMEDLIMLSVSQI